MKVSFVSSPDFRRHQNGSYESGLYHPEIPDRLDAIENRLHRLGLWDELEIVEPMPATAGQLGSVHDLDYVTYVERACEEGPLSLDYDTGVVRESFLAATLAAGGACQAVDLVMSDAADAVFCAVRPPGHHAERDAAMGFCLFNNVAIGARWLRTRGVGRIVIVDWDVHHGNGTQESFWDDPDTLYVSTHQYPFYPGTGAASEVGRGAAAGRTLNVPLPAGCGDDEYVAAFTELIAPVAEQFRPELVLISAGFDADYRDPLAGMQATDAGFRAMTRVLMRVAERHASGRIAAILEGGYDLDALRAAVPAVLDELAGAELGEALPAPTPRGRVLAEARAAQKPFWELPE